MSMRPSRNHDGADGVGGVRPGHGRAPAAGKGGEAGGLLGSCSTAGRERPGRRAVTIRSASLAVDSGGGTRTRDLRGMNPVCCQLHYPAVRRRRDRCDPAVVVGPAASAKSLPGVRDSAPTGVRRMVIGEGGGCCHGVDLKDT